MTYSKRRTVQRAVSLAVAVSLGATLVAAGASWWLIAAVVVVATLAIRYVTDPWVEGDQR